MSADAQWWLNAIVLPALCLLTMLLILYVNWRRYRGLDPLPWVATLTGVIAAVVVGFDIYFGLWFAAAVWMAVVMMMAAIYRWNLVELRAEAIVRAYRRAKEQERRYS